MAILTAVALGLAACGGGDDAGDEAAEPAANSDVTDAEPTGQDDDPGDANDAADADDDGVLRVIDTSLAPEDGYDDALDLDIPSAGLAVLEVDGQTFEFEAACSGTGVVPDSIMDGHSPLNQFIIFNFGMRGDAQVEGQPWQLQVSRAIHVAGDQALNINHAGYGGEGQVDRVSLGTQSDGSSQVQSPSGDDPQGTQLPLVRVTEDGTVTAQGELARVFDEDSAPEGAFTLAGRCQDGWPQDELDAAAG